MLDGSRRWWALGAAGLLGASGVGLWLLPVLTRLVVGYFSEPLDERNMHAGVASMLLGAVSLVVSIGAVAVAWLQLRQGHAMRTGSIAVHGGGPGSPAPPGMTSLAAPEGLLDEQVRGRDGLIAELMSLYRWRSRRAPRVRVLHGMGGAGKTTIAIVVARQLHRRGVQVWWVSAATATDLQIGMRQLTRRLGATEAEIDRAWTGQDSAPDLLWRVLSRHQSRWLIVIDNADDTRILAAADSCRSPAP